MVSNFTLSFICSFPDFTASSVKYIVIILVKEAGSTFYFHDNYIVFDLVLLRVLKIEVRMCLKFSYYLLFFNKEVGFSTAKLGEADNNVTTHNTPVTLSIL